MTRLTEGDLKGIDREIALYDGELLRKTGLSLRQIASVAAGVSEQAIIERASRSKVAIIPITAGEGLITSFGGVVRSIVERLHFQAVVTTETDVAGIAEGIAGGAELLFMADDHKFIALNLSTGALADNGEATGRGFVAALNGMARGLQGRRVLVLGAGAVGAGAVASLRELGAEVALFEIDENRIGQFADISGIRLESDLKKALAAYRYIVDATPQGDFIEPGDLAAGVMLACPGIPIGLTPAARTLLKDKFIHDPLQLGVATMLAMVLQKC